MKSNFIEFHRDGESIFINKNMIVAISCEPIPNSLKESHICDTVIDCIDNSTCIVDENINEVIKCLE